MLLSCLSIRAQHSLSSALHATTQTIEVTPQRPIDPGPPDTTIVPIDIHEDYMEDPNSPGTPPPTAGTLPYDIVHPNNGHVNVSIPIESFSTQHESSHGMSMTYVGGTLFTVMGRGWELTGASVISRRGRDFFTDGNTSSVSLSDDCWSLDGTYLIYEGMSNGVRRYRTQVGNTIALRDAYGFFTVLHPDGGVSYYGERDSLSNHVTRHVAVDGSETTYTYLDSSCGYRLLSAVDYGENRRLSFHYKRLYPMVTSLRQTRYSAGIAICHSHRLDSIHVSKDGRTLTSYVLRYPDSSQPETQPRMLCRLDSAGSVQLRPLSLSYHGEGESKFTMTEKHLELMLDVDSHDMGKLIIGRGRFDPTSEDEGLLLFANRQNYNRDFLNESGFVYKTDYTVQDRLIVTTGMHYSGQDIPCAEIAADTCFVEAFPMDVDGHAGDELVRVNNQVYGGSDITTFTVFANDGVTMRRLFSRTLAMPALTATNSSGLKSVRPKAFLPGDFDGDGRSDLLVLSYSCPDPSSTPGRVDLIDLMTGNTKCTATIDSCTLLCFSWDDSSITDTEKWRLFNHSDRVIVLDHDGDGKKELGIINENGLYIYSFSFTDTGDLAMRRTRADCPVSLSDLEYLDAVSCDLNGDGNTDIVALRKTAAKAGDTERVTLISDGAGRFMSSVSKAAGSPSLWETALTDYDRDGCTDIVQVNSSWAKLLQLPADSRLVGGNVYDSNIATLAAIRPSGKVLLYRYENPVDIASSIAGIKDGSGKERLFTHGRMFLNHDSGYSSDTYDFPLCAVGDGLLVSTRERLMMDGNPISVVNYDYSGPTLHKQGPGFLGFSVVNSMDSVTGETSQEEYSMEHLGMLRYKATHQKTVELTPKMTIAPNRHLTFTTAQEMTRDLSTGVTATTAYTHDSYGNVLTATTTLPGGIVKSVTNEWHNVDSAGVWLVGLERRHTESVTLGGETVTEGRTTRYNASWLPDTIVTWRGDELHPVQTCVIRYDGMGRPDRVRTRAYSGDWRTRHIGYSGDSRLPDFVSDEMGMRTTLTYGDFGPLASSVAPEVSTWLDDDFPFVPIDGPVTPLHDGDSPNGGSGTVIDPPGYSPLTTRYHYDSVGRRDSVTAPDGSARATSLTWADEADGAAYVEEITETGKPDVRVWRDALGRTVKRATRRFDGSWSYTLHEYDARGRLCRESMPTLTGAASQWTEYTYDSFDRLTRKEYPDGHADTYSYDGLSATSVVDGVCSTRTVDALGNLVAVEDDGGTLQYTLRPDGQPSAIHAPGGVATIVEYDGYGRRTAIHDPSAGTRATAYDADGHVSAETDARGKTIASSFDSRGLLISRSFDGGSPVTCSYDAWNRPTAMTGGGHSKSWTYDALGRTATETVDGFKKTYAYDKNLPVSVAYSKDNEYICTENHSRMNGHLTSITLSTGDTLWTLRGQNARLLPTKAAMGSVGLSLSYDQRGHVVSRVAVGPCGELQRQYTPYDPATGNMASREDWLRDTSEEFGYDSMNRLTGVSLYSDATGDRECAIVYDGKGNILSGTDMGQLSYGVQRPYAFNALLTGSPLIPEREQHVSYNAMQLPDTISEGGYTAAFDYFGDMSRATMTVSDSLGHTAETRVYYDGRYSEFAKTADDITQTKRVLWLGGTPYNAPAALLKDYGDSGWQLVHVLRDNLGSVTHVVDTAGMVLQELSYSAWGLLRDPLTLEPYGPDAQPDLLLGRGYTGHEHLPWFGLVNMNARLYDPAVGRFLSPDPLIQAPDNTQSYNRYSYCLNNPLRYADESGMNYYYLNPWLGGWRYQQYEQSSDMRINLPELVFCQGRSTWSRWSSAIENPFVYRSWQGYSLPTPADWRMNRYGSPVSYFNNPYDATGGVASGVMGGKSDNSYLGKSIEWGSSRLSVASLNCTTLNGSLFWADNVLKNRSLYAEARTLPDHFPITIQPKPLPFNIETTAKTLRVASKVTRTAGILGLGLACADIGLTADNGHMNVAFAKIGVFFAEAAISYCVPAGPLFVMGFELLDAHYHWKDQMYQDYIDCTYSTDF